MRRREMLAGVASLGTLGAGAAAAVYGLPSRDDDGERRHDPVEITTVEASGSQAGTVRIPNEGRPTFVDLFATTCTVCQEQMPTLGEVYDEFGDEMTFLSVTNESRSVVSDDELGTWWADHDGRWTVGRDVTSELIVHYGTATPTAVLFDADGRVVWEDTGRKAAEEFQENIRPVVEASP